MDGNKRTDKRFDILREFVAASHTSKKMTCKSPLTMLYGMVKAGLLHQRLDGGIGLSASTKGPASLITKLVERETVRKAYESTC